MHGRNRSIADTDKPPKRGEGFGRRGWDAASGDVSERLDIIPAQFRVIVTRRPKYACRSLHGWRGSGTGPCTADHHCCGLSRDHV